MKGLKERVAYLEGLAEGMDLGKSKEGKLISEILGVLEDMVDYIDAVAESQEDLESYVESMDSDLSDLEDDFYGEEEDEDDFVGRLPAQIAARKSALIPTSFMTRTLSKLPALHVALSFSSTAMKMPMI